MEHAMSASPRRAGLACAIAAALALAGIATASMSASAATSASATCQNWTGEPPKAPGTTTNFLMSVSVLTSCDAWTVGYQSDGGASSTLTEHWNGSGWAVVSSPNPGDGTLDQLTSVRGISPSDIWAVGTYSDGTSAKTLTLHWNGSKWTQVPSPDPAGSTRSGLAGVRAVTAKNAWAVGSYFAGGTSKTLILHWNGTAWKQVASPSPGGDATLAAVTATSSSNAWAVGRSLQSSGDKSLILHWNGASWKQVASPNRAGSNDLTSIAASSASNAWAVGVATSNGIDQTLALHWNGRRWNPVASPDPGGSGNDNGLNAVAVSAPSEAWAVGSSASGPSRHTLILHWSGSRWIRVPSPNPATANNLTAVAARSADNLWAVGTYVNGTVIEPIALHCC
jgi:hypothetical protein